MTEPVPAVAVREDTNVAIGLGRAKERAAIVAWLRETGLTVLAQHIEQGAHLGGGESGE